MINNKWIFILIVLSIFLVSSSNSHAKISVSLQEFYEGNESFWPLDTSTMIYEVYSDYFNEVNIGTSEHKILMDYDRDEIRHRYDVYYGEVVDNRRFLIAFNKAFTLDYIKDNVNIYAGVNQQNYYDLTGQPGFVEWVQAGIDKASEVGILGAIGWVGEQIGDVMFPEKNVVKLNNLDGRWYPVTTKTDLGIILNSSGKISTSDYNEIVDAGSDYLDALNFDEYYYFLVDIENTEEEKTEVYLSVDYPKNFENDRYSDAIFADTGVNYNFTKLDAVVRIQTGLPDSQIQNTLTFTDKITEVVYNLTSILNEIFTIILNLVVLSYFAFVIMKIIDIVLLVAKGVRDYEI